MGRALVHCVTARVRHDGEGDKGVGARRQTDSIPRVNPLFLASSPSDQTSISPTER
jgi:hypothetical protein